MGANMAFVSGYSNGRRCENQERVMQVWEFEEAAWRVDHVRVVVRAPKRTAVEDFEWVNAYDEKAKVASYIRTRLSSKIGDYEVSIYDGRGLEPNGNMYIRRVRTSYREAE
jgi:hypothetical protein